MRFGLRAVVAAAVVVGSLAGCADRGEPTGTIAGKVKMGSRPVSGLMVSLTLPGKGVGASAVLDEAGAFSIFAPVPAGEYVVTLTPKVPEPPRPGERPTAIAPTVLPPRFAREDKSDLRAMVKPGHNELVIEVPAS